MKNTKQEIINVSLELFNEYGYSAVTMRQIAEKLNISVGNLTYHFKKKDDILLTIMNSTESLKTVDKADNLSDLKEYLYIMMEPTVKQRFYFIHAKEISSNDFFIQRHHNKLKLIKDNILFIFEELDKKAYFNSLFDTKQREAFVYMLILSHLGWADEYHSVSEIEPFLSKHLLLLKPYLTDKALEELENILK